MARFHGGRCWVAVMRRIARIRALVLGACWTIGVVGCSPVPDLSPSGPPAAAAQAYSLPSYAMIWPSDGALAASFGPRGDEHHDGIDILAKEGRPVRAALGGEVLFAGSLPGYGNVVILQHPKALTTVYAHNQVNRVRAGARVRRGEVIALVGRTGRATAPNLHFEVRRRNQARDPMQYLPRRTVETASLDRHSGS
ncbi:MAG: M23 family metallopeptidase [Candidatus Binatia bacterium]|nr:M23 family metallopeptidase [Candidatus Binatia bacterium]MDG2010637.1 M23 family metallopeptidase [Candidatus Binatia bacterium]